MCVCVLERVKTTRAKQKRAQNKLDMRIKKKRNKNNCHKREIYETKAHERVQTKKNANNVVLYCCLEPKHTSKTIKV